MNKLVETAQKFIKKVDEGKAKSTESYNEFKETLKGLEPDEDNWVTIQALEGSWIIPPNETTPKQYEEVISKLVRALCFTRDYVSPKVALPPIEGWEWFDACKMAEKIIPKDKWIEEFNKRINPKVENNTNNSVEQNTTNKEEFTQGQELNFDIYGTRLSGKYISTNSDDKKIIIIEVIEDSTEVSKKGEKCSVNKSFIIKN